MALCRAVDTFVQRYPIATDVRLARCDDLKSWNFGFLEPHRSYMVMLDAVVKHNAVSLDPFVQFRKPRALHVSWN